ncbi:tRNA (adenosine(37)-N6)-threonylcarbamoyltransferase complex ATPase subunit type 1 TsaE [Vulcanococcus sp.]|jgi:tRNA threonylcarbamoyladenosine biosynthesis protein TsaE|uniref:tRNA (adenosine(37)-N6)-threonylcarbamoyltransferase complex ATPase subunit type 1 TsaE n=1 Tax=Vulcanococcus sp. TaxID=2856995 RepID=UPI0037DA000B
MDSRCVVLADAAATAALGAELAGLWLQQPSASSAQILLLEGNLGAGKTSLVQGIAAALGIEEPITSPSFALAQHYSGSCRGRSTALVHLDLYRLEQPAAAEELFAQEEEEAQALGALLAVEWPGRLLVEPEGAWRVELQLLDPLEPEAGRRAVLRLPPGGPGAPQ